MSNTGIPQEEKEKELKDIEIQLKEERFRLSFTYLNHLIDDIINAPENENPMNYQHMIEYMNATLHFCKELKAQIRLMEKEKQNDTK